MELEVGLASIAMRNANIGKPFTALYSFHVRRAFRIMDRTSISDIMPIDHTLIRLPNSILTPYRNLK